ncbi:TRAP transporter small permease [Thioclava sp. GXIMD2076]|uniref:TRAP transporter small permease n=1 Tax=unclassified Thioclava TaxID=2621713 RepID=UPI0030D1847F
MKPADLSLRDSGEQAGEGAGLPSAHTVLAVLGGILLMAMMGLTVVDVVGRYLFNAPLKGAAELTELLLCATIFLGLPAVALRNEHVTVDLVTDAMPDRWQPWRRMACGIFSAVVLGVVTWRIWVYADQIAGYGGATTNLLLPIAPLGYFCAICTAVGMIMAVYVPFQALITRATKG